MATVVTGRSSANDAVVLPSPEPVQGCDTSSRELRAEPGRSSVSALPSRASYAQRVIDRDYGPFRRDVLNAVRGRLYRLRLHFNESDIDGYYNQAWQALFDAMSAGEKIENPIGYLVRVALNQAIDAARSSWSTHVVDDELVTEASLDESDVDAGVHLPVQEAAVTVDFAEAIDRRALVRHLRAQMQEKLTARECQAATLCLIHGWSRPQAARLLGTPERRMERIMDTVMRKLPAIAAPVAAQDVCPSQAATIRAYALGRLAVGDDRHAEAVVHLAGCADCTRFCAAVRNLAAVMPPVAGGRD